MYYKKLSEFKDTTFDSFLGVDLAKNETKESDPIGTTSYVQHLPGSGRHLYCWVSKNRLYDQFESDINPYLKSIFVDVDDLLYLYTEGCHYDANIQIDDLMAYLYGISRYEWVGINTEKIYSYIQEIDYFAKTGYTVSVSGLKFRIDKNQLDNYRQLMETDTVIDAIDYKDCLVGKIRTKHIECILDNKLIHKP